MAELEADAVALMDYLGLKNTAFDGLSFGGLIAQGIAEKTAQFGTFAGSI